MAVSNRICPVLNQAWLQLLRGDLALIKTRNGLLPLMDLFITLGKGGYANSFGNSVDYIDEDNYDALDNLPQLVEVDVRTAYIEVDRTKQQFAASSIRVGSMRKNCAWKIHQLSGPVREPESLAK